MAHRVVSLRCKIRSLTERSGQLPASTLTNSVAVAVPASASVVTAAFTGTVTSAYDNIGLFGDVVPCCGNPAYNSDSYTAIFLFDTSLGSGNTSNIVGGISVYGGTASSLSSPALSATVTVNGHTASIDGSYFSSFYYDPSHLLNTSTNVSNAPIGGNTNYSLVEIFNNNPFPTAGFNLTYPDPPPTNASGNCCYVSVVATIANVTVSTTPLPSTWLMLLSGFLGLGFLAYRGTKKNAVATV